MLENKLLISDDGILLENYDLRSPKYGKFSRPSIEYRKKYYKKNKKQILRKMKIYHCKHKNEIQTRMRKYYYNIDEKTYNERFKLQGNVCAICKGKNYKFHVDHNHVTKNFRGILCNKCNSALGFINEDINIAKAIIKYLKRDSLNA